MAAWDIDYNYDERMGYEPEQAPIARRTDAARRAQAALRADGYTWTLSAEVRARMGDAHRGITTKLKGTKLSAEHKQAVSEGVRRAMAEGKIHTPERNAKISASLKGRQVGGAVPGRPKSAETKLKMAEAARRRWAKKKEAK